MVVKKIGVVGAGQMGHGIALVSAQAGFEVLLRDIKDEFVRRGINRVDKFLSKSVEKGKLSEDDKKKILGRIKGTTELSDLKDVDLVIEAVFENVDVKKELFRERNNPAKLKVVQARYDKEVADFKEKDTNAESVVSDLCGQVICQEEISSAMSLLLQLSFTAQLGFP